MILESRTLFDFMTGRVDDNVFPFEFNFDLANADALFPYHLKWSTKVFRKPQLQPEQKQHKGRGARLIPSSCSSSIVLEAVA